MTLPYTFGQQVQITITRFEDDGFGRTWVEGEFLGVTFKPFRLDTTGGFDTLKLPIVTRILTDAAEAISAQDA